MASLQAQNGVNQQCSTVGQQIESAATLLIKRIILLHSAFTQANQATLLAMLSPQLQQLHQELGIPAEYPHQPAKLLFSEASELVDLGEDVFHRKLRLAPDAANAWHRMQTAAKVEEVHLLPISGFRDYAYQANLIHKKLAAGQAISDILRVVAAPGFSEHHTGRAIDIASSDYEPLEVVFESSPEFLWLQQHAHEYNFVMSYPQNNVYGFIYEPWHWCYQEK